MTNLTITLNKVKADIEFPIILENIDSGEVVLFLNKFDRVVLKSAGGRGPYYISSRVDLYDTNVWRRFRGSIEISNDTPSASTELPENVTDKVQALAEQHGIACDAKLNQFAIDLLSTTMVPKTYPPFPVMLRKMWTGSEVQDWIDDHIIQALPTKTSSLTPVKNTEKPIQEWKQVPVNLTEDMHTAAVRTITKCTGNSDFPARVYEAMLNAAPQPTEENSTLEEASKNKCADREGAFVEPDPALLVSMASCLRHDFALLSKTEQESMLYGMKKLYKEVTGQGFFNAETRERYLSALPGVDKVDPSWLEKIPVCQICGDGITPHNPGICGTCHSLLDL